MVFLRMILTLALMALVLPWGAFLPAAQASGAPVSGSVQDADTGQAVRAPLQAAYSPFLPRKCRLVKLPGSPCGPQVVLPPETELAAPERGTEAVRVGAALRRFDLALPPPVTPPRLV